MLTFILNVVSRNCWRWDGCSRKKKPLSYKAQSRYIMEAGGQMMLYNPFYFFLWLLHVVSYLPPQLIYFVFSDYLIFLHILRSEINPDLYYEIPLLHISSSFFLKLSPLLHIILLIQ